MQIFTSRQFIRKEKILICKRVKRVRTVRARANWFTDRGLAWG